MNDVFMVVTVLVSISDVKEGGAAGWMQIITYAEGKTPAHGGRGP